MQAKKSLSLFLPALLDALREAGLTATLAVSGISTGEALLATLAAGSGAIYWMLLRF